MPKGDLKIFRVAPKTQRAGAEQPPRLIRAERRKDVEAYLLNELHIDVATQDQCIEAAKSAIDVENVTPEDPLTIL